MPPARTWGAPTERHQQRQGRPRPAAYVMSCKGPLYSAMSVLAFASDDDEAVLEFEAAWALTLQNVSRGSGRR